MRNAPPVQVRSHCVGWRLLQSLLIALAAAALVAWALLHAEWPAWPVGPAALLVGVTAWRCMASEPVVLAWDGGIWQVDGVAGNVDLMLDLAGCLLVRFRPLPAGAPRWIALSRRDTGAAEHALRVALYARAPVAPDAAAELWRSS